MTRGYAVGPIAAPSMDECCRQSTVSSLRACVERVASEHAIDDRDLVRTLVAMVDATQAAVDRGQCGAALHVLAAFVRALDAQSGRHVELRTAAYLRQHAGHVIQALGT